MATSLAATYAAILEQSCQETLSTARAVPETMRLKQLQPGKATPLWLVGHLANTMNTVVLRWTLDVPSILSSEQSALFAPDFRGGKPPVSDASEYPPFDDVIALYEQAFESALPGIRAFDDSVLDGPLQGPVPDRARERFPTVDYSLRRMIQHDAYHRGQIGMLSKLDDA